jgi:hypothetical protein
MVRTSQAAEACMPVPTLPEPAGGERPSVRRRDERHSVRLTALAHCHGRFQTVRIVDFSAGGLQLQGGFGVGPGDEVVVELLSGDRLAAKAAWSLGSRTGVRFLQPLAADHPAWAVLEQAVRRMAERARE